MSGLELAALFHIARQERRRAIEVREGRMTESLKLSQLRDWTIHILVKSNPRRERTHGHWSFESYREGMTVGEYLDQDFDATLPIDQGRSHGIYTGPHARHLNYDRGWRDQQRQWKTPFVELRPPTVPR